MEADFRINPRDGGQHLGPRLQNRIPNLSRAQFQEIERAAIDEVWRESGT